MSKAHESPIRTISVEDFVVVLPEVSGGASTGGSVVEEEYCLDPSTSRPNLFSNETIKKATIPIGQAVLTEVSSALESGCAAKIMRQTAKTSLEKQLSFKRSCFAKGSLDIGSFEVLDADEADFTNAGDGSCSDSCCDSILVQKIRIVSRENSSEDYLLLVDTQKSEEDDHRSMPLAVASSALQRGVALTRESSHPLGICRTPSLTPVQLDFSSSSVEFDSTLQQTHGSHSSSVSTNASSGSTSSSVSIGQNSHSPDPRNSDPGQCLVNGHSNGTGLSVHSNKVSSNGVKASSSSEHSGGHHLTSAQSSDCELSDHQLCNCLASCGLDKTSKRSKAVELGSQHSSGGSRNTEAQDSEDSTRTRQGEMAGDRILDKEDDVERDGPFSEIIREVVMAAPNISKEELASMLSRKNAVKKRSGGGEELKSWRAEALIQEEQLTTAGGRGTTPNTLTGGRGSAPNSPSSYYQNRVKQGRQSDPGKRPVYLKKSKLEMARACSEPNQTDFIHADYLKEISRDVSSENLTEPSSLNLGTAAIARGLPSERAIQKCIECNCQQFLSYTNWKALVPYLMGEELLDAHTRELLTNNFTTSRDKGLAFYCNVLPSKGNTAYSKFYNSLAQEKEHIGHRTLLELLDRHEM